MECPECSASVRNLIGYRNAKNGYGYLRCEVCGAESPEGRWSTPIMDMWIWEVEQRKAPEREAAARLEQIQKTRGGYL